MVTILRGTLLPDSNLTDATDAQVLDLARKGMTSASMKGTLEVVAVASKFDHYDKSKTGIPCACCCAPRVGQPNAGGMPYVMVLTTKEIAVFTIYNGNVSLQRGMAFGMGGQHVYPGKLKDGISLRLTGSGHIHISKNVPRLTRGTQHDTTPVGVFGWFGFVGIGDGALGRPQFDASQGEEVVRALTKKIQELTPVAATDDVPAVTDMLRTAVAEPVSPPVVGGGAKFCSNCGAAFGEGGNFCAGCGKSR